MDNNDVVKRCRQALEQCGYNAEEIKFKVERKKEGIEDETGKKSIEIEKKMMRLNCQKNIVVFTLKKNFLVI